MYALAVGLRRGLRMRGGSGRRGDVPGSHATSSAQARKETGACQQSHERRKNGLRGSWGTIERHLSARRKAPLVVEPGGGWARMPSGQQSNA